MGFFLGMIVGPFGLMMIAFTPAYRRGAPVQQVFIEREQPSARNLPPWISYGILFFVVAAFAAGLFWVGR
jgi:hypothetical protein